MNAVAVPRDLSSNARPPLSRLFLLLSQASHQILFLNWCLLARAATWWRGVPPSSEDLDHLSPPIDGHPLLSTRSMKHSRLRLTSASVLWATISGRGSRATSLAPAYGP